MVVGLGRLGVRVPGVAVHDVDSAKVFELVFDNPKATLACLGPTHGEVDAVLPHEGLDDVSVYTVTHV